MQIEIFSDVVCPWCYIGKRHLEEALESFLHADKVDVVYRSFQLDPTTPEDVAETMTEALGRKYNQAPAQIAEMQQRVIDTAAAAGLDFQLEHTHPENTFDAHRLLHWALEHGKQSELKERLMSAYFTEGARVGRHEVLADLAAEVGLDRAEAERVLASTEYSGEVGSDLSLARSFGATGVPFFVFDRTYAVSGGQPATVFTEVLEKAWSEGNPLTTVGGDGQACTDDSCSI
ncbi:DsbA family oxidoreductase [Nakamurella silvestris]|nr:DsbA family oxidoreductase [Nakamurella silvestris]